jgi:hypothetical protein|eukprot:COSAG01_NODE_1748_length_9329_cov_99.035861_7_plen_53_part_00
MGPLAQNPSQSAAWPKPLSMSSKYCSCSHELPVTGLPLENLADLGSPASNLP